MTKGQKLGKIYIFTKMIEFSSNAIKVTHKNLLQDTII